MTSTFLRIPSIGDVNSYISAALNMPYLTPEEEIKYAKAMKNGDVQAAQFLVLSHLRLVVSISRKYLNYGFPQEDLIQEGNIGLMKAVKKFDVDRGIHLSTYALHWIHSCILEYVISNWNIVKITTTKAHRKLFFKLKQLKDEIQNYKNSTLNSAEVVEISDALKVKSSDVREMEIRLAGGSLSLDLEGDNLYEHLSDVYQNPEEILNRQNYERLLETQLPEAINKLSDREQEIINSRWISSEQKTLQELGKNFNISSERVRQIELSAMKKLRVQLT